MSQQRQSPTNINPPSKITKKPLELLLPPKMSKKKTLVLDLDETLVHSQFGAFNIPSDVIINIEIENELHDIHVLIRPGVKEFLEKMSKKYEIVIFTASISKYAGPLLDILDKEKFCSFRLFREHCTLLNSSFVKDLKKLGRDLKDVIIVDNSPMAYLLNSDNGLPILTWFDDKNDKELYKIIPILDFLSLVPDVREYIHKIVINNEISYDNAIRLINEYNSKNKRINDEIEKKEMNDDQNVSIEENLEISDGSDNNLAVIKQDKNQQQININIINNNITNYIYDNNQKPKDENISDNIINNKIQNNINKHNFNPNSIIASVSKPINPQALSSLNPVIKEKNNNKYSKSTKNLNSKNSPQNKNNNLPKKDEGSGIGNNQKTKNINYEDILKINERIKNNINKNNLLKNKTNNNHNSKSHSRKETKAKLKTNNDNENRNTKSAKFINKPKKQLYINSNNRNILVNKKSSMKNNIGSMTTTHNKQKIKLIQNNEEKTNINYNKKNNPNVTNNLIHSVDLAKNEIAVYYHNDNFPFSKKDNIINNGILTNKNRNINKFLNNNNFNNNKKSSSIDNEMTKNPSEKNNFNNIKHNNDFNFSKNRNMDKKILINPTLIEEQKKLYIQKEKIQILTNNNKILKQNTKTNSALNINSNPNVNLNNLAHSQQINPFELRVNNIILNEKEQKANKNKKNNANKRPKSSTIYKNNNNKLNRTKQIKRNASGRNGKNINIMKYDIIEILERRGIAKTNRLKHHKEENNYNFNYNNYIQNNNAINNINQNMKNKNIQNNKNEKNKTFDNIIKIKTKDL